MKERSQTEAVGRLQRKTHVPSVAPRNTFPHLPTASQQLSIELSALLCLLHALDPPFSALDLSFAPFGGCWRLLAVILKCKLAPGRNALGVGHNLGWLHAGVRS